MKRVLRFTAMLAGMGLALAVSAQTAPATRPAKPPKQAAARPAAQPAIPMDIQAIHEKLAADLAAVPDIAKAQGRFGIVVNPAADDSSLGDMPGAALQVAAMLNSSPLRTKISFVKGAVGKMPGAPAADAVAPIQFALTINVKRETADSPFLLSAKLTQVPTGATVFEKNYEVPQVK